MTRRVLTFVVALVVAALLIVGGYHLGHRQPSCPTEDSCLVYYHNGHWVIAPTIP